MTADTLRLLSDESTALHHRLQLIDAAQHELLFSAYEVGDDPVALRILAGLRSAAARGVDVKLIIDGHSGNNLMPKVLMQHLIEHGVAVREHLPDVRYQVDLGRQRMHDKLLIVDGQHLIMGGRNLRADYYGLAESNFTDREVYLIGSTAAHARSYFLARWHAGTSGVPDLNRAEKKSVLKRQELAFLNVADASKHGIGHRQPSTAYSASRLDALAGAAAVLDQALTAPLPMSSTCCAEHSLQCECEKFFFVERLCFLHDIPDQSKDLPGAIAHQLHQAIGAAQHCITIETPYFVPTRELRHYLLAARRRGVSIAVMTNSLETTNQRIVHAQYANERHWMREAGIELWELKGANHLHAKSMVIDNKRAMIGSYNFDVLSTNRNSEVALLIDDAEFAEALAHQIRCHMQGAQQVPPSGPLIGFDKRTNNLDKQELRQAIRHRFVSPWIKKYL